MRYKLIVFVPDAYLEKVRDAVCDAGAGKVGNYDRCTFAAEGTGTFRPLKGAKPYLGRIGRIKKVKEFRLEVLVDGRSLKKAVSAMKKAHPYEEPAYDIIRLTAI